MLLESPKISQHEWKSKFKRRKRKKIKNGKSRNRLGEQKKNKDKNKRYFFDVRFFLLVIFHGIWDKKRLTNKQKLLVSFLLIIL